MSIKLAECDYIIIINAMCEYVILVGYGVKWIDQIDRNMVNGLISCNFEDRNAFPPHKWLIPNKYFTKTEVVWTKTNRYYVESNR